MSILKQIKWKDQNGTETLMDIGADAVNVVTDSTHRFASDAEKSKWNAKMETTSDAADNTVSFTPAGTRSNISSGEKLSNIFGKIAKYFTDLKAVAFSGNYNDLTNKPAALKNPNALKANGKTYDGSAAVDVGTVGIAYGGTGATTAAAARINLGLGTAATQGVANNCTTTAAGYALDARQGKVLKEEVNELNGSLQATNAKIDNRTSDLVSGTIIVTAGADVDVKSISKQNKIAHLFINGKAKYNLSDDGVSHFQASIPPIGYEYRPIYIRNGVSSRIQLILIDTNGNISLSGGNIATGETFTIAVDYSCN